MKRTALAILASLALAGTVQAQNYLIENPDNKAYLGLRLGLDISSTAGSADDSFGNGPGLTIGAVYNIPLWKNLFFEPGVHFFYDTFDNDISTWDPVTNITNEYDGSIRNCGFRVPLNFGYRFDFTDDISISLFTGPVLNTNITAKAHCESLNDYTYSVMENGFKRFDMQWDFGVSMNYSHNYYVSITGAIGMTKVFNPSNDDISFRRNTCNIAIGYNF